MTKIAKLIEKAQNDELDILDILHDITKGNVSELEPFIPKLMKHKSWLIRTEILEIIGTFCLKDYTDLVKKSLEDNNFHVRSYALTAYYDLLKSKAIPRIKKYCNEKNVSVRLTALIIIFIETENDEILERIDKIVTRKNCSYYHQYVVLNTFEDYLDVKTYPEIISLYRKMLQTIPKDYAIAKDLRKRLVELNVI